MVMWTGAEKSFNKIQHSFMFKLGKRQELKLIKSKYQKCVETCTYIMMNP